jgi:hypothetical protein
MDIGEAFFQARANHPARGGNRLILLDGQIQAGMAQGSPKDFPMHLPRMPRGESAFARVFDTLWRRAADPGSDLERG